MASPSLREFFPATVELFSTFIKQMKAENPQLNVSEASFARGKAVKNSFGKRHSTGISNVSNAAVDDRLFEKHEYNALTPDQKNMLRLKRLKRGHVGKGHTVNGNSNGRNNGKGATLKSLTRSIAALSVGSRTRDRSKGEPGLVKKISDPQDLIIFNQARKKSSRFLISQEERLKSHPSFTSLLHNNLFRETVFSLLQLDRKQENRDYRMESSFQHYYVEVKEY
jgi:hypothetical protein